MFALVEIIGNSKHLQSILETSCFVIRMPTFLLPPVISPNILLLAGHNHVVGIASLLFSTKSLK